jgi:hypothetical protein
MEYSWWLVKGVPQAMLWGYTGWVVWRCLKSTPVERGLRGGNRIIGKPVVVLFIGFGLWVATLMLLKVLDRR